MKTSIKYMFVALLCSLQSVAQPTVQASRLLCDSTGSDHILEGHEYIINSKFGGFWMLANQSRVLGPSIDNSVLVRLDANLNIINGRYMNVGTGYQTYAKGITELPDGTVVACFSIHNQTLDPNCFVCLPPYSRHPAQKLGNNIMACKIDTAMRMLWYKEYGGNVGIPDNSPMISQARGIAYMPGGKIAVGVATNDTTGDFSGAPHQGAPCALVLDTAGTLLSVNYFNLTGVNASNQAVVLEMKIDPLHGLYFMFQQQNIGYVIYAKTDFECVQQWEYNNNSRASVSLCPTPDNGLIIMNRQRGVLCGGYALDKVDAQGVGSPIGGCITASEFAVPTLSFPDGSGYLYLGRTNYGNAKIAKLDTALNVVWVDSIGGSSFDVFDGGLLTPTGELLAYGTSKSLDGALQGMPFAGAPTGHSSNYWLVKYASVLSTKEERVSATQNWRVASLGGAKYQVSFLGDLVKYPVRMVLTDVLGKELHSYTAQSAQLVIDLSEYTQGVYYLRSTYGTEKLVR